MRKTYPYLEDSYFYNTDVERQKRTVLEDIQKFANQRQYIKMTLLDWEEHPLKEIEGEISSGSISKNGDSPVRRTANLSCAVDARSYSVEDGKADFAINKKIFIEIGILNETDKYSDYPIFWFPQGVFFIGSFAINSSSTGSTNINLTLKDKMAMLNGDVGGTLPALVIFDSMDTQLPDGSYATKKVLIYNIIKECVNHYGGEDLNNIVIEDVPLRIRRIMRWMGSTPLYMINTTDISQVSQSDFHFQLEEPANYDPEDTHFHKYYTGDDIGYVRDDFVVIDELVGNAGETVVSILDKIKNLLGNYEYFYDVFGVFHFREIKNYLNTTQGEKLLSEMAEKDYLVEVNNERSTFTFSDESILTSITVTPKYENIKNDFIVQGLREGTSSDIAYDVRYHLAIDTKPRSIGVDNREQISFPKDFSKEIAAGEADLLTLQNKIKEGEQQKNNHQSAINKLNTRKEQRYREVIKYGDLLKRELQHIVGDLSLPLDQPIGNLGLKTDVNEYPCLHNNISDLITTSWCIGMNDYDCGCEDEQQMYICKDCGYIYLISAHGCEDCDGEQEEELWANNLNKWIDPTTFISWQTIRHDLRYTIQYPYEELIDEKWPYFYYNEKFWNEYKDNAIQQLANLQIVDDTEFIEAFANNSLKYTQYVYENLTPEGFWYLVQTKVLQDLYRATIEQEYQQQLIAWEAAVEAIEQGKDGYKYITPTKIQIPEKLYIHQPISIDLTNYPENFYNVGLSDLALKETDKVKNIKNIYTDYILFLNNKEAQQSKIIDDITDSLAVVNEEEAKILDIVNKYGYIIDIVTAYSAILAQNLETWQPSILHSIEEGSQTEPIYIAIQQILYRHYMDSLPEGEETLSVVWGTDEVNEYWNDYFKNSFIYLQQRIPQESESIDYYSNFIRELEELRKTAEDLESAANDSQNNKTSLLGLYNNDSLIQKWEGINIYYNKYQTELSNYYLVLKDIEVREAAPAVRELSAAEIHDFLNTLLSKGYNSYLAQELKNVLVTLEEAIDGSFNVGDTTKKYEYIDTWTKVLNKLQEIINSWKVGVTETITNPHQGQKYYGFYTTRDIIIYKDPETDTIKAGFSFYAEEDASEYVDRTDLPIPGNFNLIYKKPGENKYCYWDGQAYQDLTVKYVFKCSDIKTRYYVYDWRTLLYLEGQYARILGTDAGYYYPELSAFWPRTYDLFNQCFYEEPWTTGQTNDRDLTQGNYFLDFLDSVDTTFGEWSVNNIGRRSDVVVNNEINCLFQPEIPNVNLININSNSSQSGTEQEVYDASDEIPDSLRYLEQDDPNLKGKSKVMYLRAESIYANEPYTQVDSEIYNNLLTGGYANGAFDQIKYELFLHTRYQKTISMTTIPVFYLEPNSRITVADKTTNTFGDFVIQNISLTLGPGANMSVSVVETVERF